MEMAGACAPGAVSGLLLFIALGILIFKKIFPLLPAGQRVAAVLIGMAALALISSIATRI